MFVPDEMFKLCLIKKKPTFGNDFGLVSMCI